MNDMPQTTAAAPMLQVQGLTTHLRLRRGVVRAVDGVDLHVNAGETLGVVGESGSGKSMTILSIMRLLPRQGGPDAVRLGGKVLLDGVDLLTVPEKTMSEVYRGRRISMISQDPLTSLNPVFTVGDQVSAPGRYHGITHGRGERRRNAAEVLARVRIPSPETRLDDYPHQFSGGMRQRVVTGMAIASSPRLLVADEPTSALDVTIQVQVMALLRRIQDETGVGIILITHDLGVAASLCQRVAVMYAGRIVETGDVRTLYRHPAHPYTRALLESIPHFGQRKERLFAIQGTPPSLIDPPSGCRFAARCPHRKPLCDDAYPPEIDLGQGHKASCWLLSPA
ncbi:ABC transporter ATP-binding protein [Cupriavidus basilensis]|uniref:ABC transporter ATP-binding protein n=1 Tax=Cupriavidus basilensis TaxID=68895 RepID=A0ABT6AXB5_9BURK|nr:ABC transporter ATP-binding protein [Cupriavidus basilensis]MDF3837272.1 ABC transporter ATP-binding protein [Cupriavidus basilensis]